MPQNQREESFLFTKQIVSYKKSTKKGMGNSAEENVSVTADANDPTGIPFGRPTERPLTAEPAVVHAHLLHFNQPT